MGSPPLIFLVLVGLALNQVRGVVGGHTRDPSYGFTSLPLNTSNFKVQRPYDLPVGSRYSFIDGVHKLWVLSTDKPFTATSHTSPRTEVRVVGYDYSSGVWQFEGHAYIPSGTSGACIMQIHGPDPVPATSLMLTVFDGALMFYRKLLVADDIYGRWFRLNVINDISARKIKIFIDGELKLVVDDRGGRSHYFKFGVYAYNNSYFKESLWKGIKVYKLSD